MKASPANANNLTIFTRAALRNQVWVMIIAENALARALMRRSQPCSLG
jgi:hypothetical protein